MKAIEREEVQLPLGLYAEVPLSAFRFVLKAPEDIDEEFYSSDFRPPEAKTAGELVEILSRLPADLPLSYSGQDVFEVRVYNYGLGTVHVQIEESWGDD